MKDRRIAIATWLTASIQGSRQANKRQWNRRALADKSGVAVSTIWRIQTGKADASPRVLAQLAHALGVSPFGDNPYAETPVVHLRIAQTLECVLQKHGILKQPQGRETVRRALLSLAEKLADIGYGAAAGDLIRAAMELESAPLKD